MVGCIIELVMRMRHPVELRYTGNRSTCAWEAALFRKMDVCVCGEERGRGGRGTGDFSQSSSSS